MERALLVALRELVAERRHPDGLAAALTFTGMLVLLESLTFGPGRAREPDIAPDQDSRGAQRRENHRIHLERAPAGDR